MRQSFAPPLKPQITLPADKGLTRLPLLFDYEWVWQTFCTQFGTPEETPQWIHPWQISYQPGNRALVSYVVQWQRGQWLVEDEFAVELVSDRAERVFRYPNDPYLPGLRLAASVLEAHELLTKYVSITPYRLRVENVRYRPATRAVLRYIASWKTTRAGKVTFFVRVTPPARISRLLNAAELAKHTGFGVPKIAGCWSEGGIVWLSKISGSTVRSQLRKGTPPAVEPILDGLARLWSTPIKPDKGHPLDLLGAFHMTERLLSHLLQGEEAHKLLQHVVVTIKAFAETWQPSTLAHNDFYDDQLLLTPEGHLVLVDFEEIGPGDPLLDVGNMLAHLRWMARFGTTPEIYDNYRYLIRSTALGRFGWKKQDLDLREAFAIFRLSTNPFRQLQRRWQSTIETSLSLVNEVLNGVP